LNFVCWMNSWFFIKKKENKNDYIESLIEAHKKGPSYVQITNKKKDYFY
jgi:hypothetical protein